MKKIFYLACLILLLISTVYQNLLSDDGNNQKNGTIIGKIIDSKTKSSLQSITIRIEGTKLGAISDKNGKFTINNIPVGMYKIKFSSVGYNTYIEPDVPITTSKTTELSIELTESTVELEGIEVKDSYFKPNLDAATSTQSLSYEDIRRSPGSQEDVIRAISLLPGVTVAQPGRNDLAVRGGAPFENLFIVDNIELANINHFGAQGSTGGALTIVNLDFVKDVSFSAGGFSSLYGDKTSSLTNITLRKGNEEKFAGKGFLSATGFGLNLEGPVDNKSSFLFSVRRSYLDILFKAFGFAFIPDYWDMQGKMDYKIDNNNSISFLAVGAIDNVTLNNDDADKRYKNSRIAYPSLKQFFTGITWQHLLDKGFYKLTLGNNYNDFFTNQSDSNLVEIFKNKSIEDESVLKFDLYYEIFNKFQLSFGNQVKWANDLNYNIKIPGYMRLDNKGDSVGLYIDTTFNVFKNATYFNLASTFGKFSLNYGTRLDYYNFMNTKFYISPRFSTVYQLNEVTAINLSIGRYYQSPSYIWLIGSPNQNLSAIKADQIVLGSNYLITEDLKVQLEVYYKEYSDYPARVYRPEAVLSPSGYDDITSDIPYGLEPISSIAKGFSQGVEFFMQKKMGDIPLYGLLSLSLCQTKFNSIDGIERIGAFDQSIIFNISFGYRFNSDWELATKFRAATGRPTTPYLSNGQLDFSRYNEGERLPAYHALDIRLDKRWFFSKYTFVTYIDIQNIYARKNVAYLKWNYETNSVEKQSSTGILPTIGVSFEF